jgi:opacity protein-like surface antigen
MKQYIVALMFLGLATISQAQEFKFGAKIGIGTVSLKPETLNSSTDFRLAIKDAQYGYYGGLFGSLKLGPIFFQPEALFNSNRVTYTYKDLKNPTMIDTVKNERYQNLDFPLLIGTKVGMLRVKAGPVAHVHLNSKSDLTSISGFKEQWRASTWGWQAGIGLNFSSRVHVDIRYEGNFSKWGTHINIGGKDYSFAQTPSRILVNLGYALN